MNTFEGKKCLVAGGTGMIGRFVVDKLKEKGAIVKTASLDSHDRAIPGVEHEIVDFRNRDECKFVTQQCDYIFSLLGIKGSPKMTIENPAKFFVPMLQFNTNIMEAAYENNVEWFLYTSSVGVYNPSPCMREDDVWKTFPSENDWFAGWAKRMGELQAEAYNKQSNWNRCSIVRPANVYGPYDNFNLETAMVIPSLILKAHNTKNNILEVWGDGTPIRDFIYAEDVADGIIYAVENKITNPINLGSGTGISIKELVDSIINVVNKDLEVKWFTNAPKGDTIRLFDMTRANEFGFYPKTNIEEGIRKTYEWMLENYESIQNRYDAFLEGKNNG